MAHVDTGETRGRKRNVDLNLVPFIDLMSVLITFLLIAAVWTQVSMIQIGTSFYGQKSEEIVPTPLEDQELVLKVGVKDSGYILTYGKQVISLPLQKGEFDEEGLVDQLKRIKQIRPTKTDAVVSVSDNLKYERLIKVMDNILVAGFPNISVATGGPR